MPKIEPKVAQWVEDEVADLPLGVKGLCLRVNEIIASVPVDFDYENFQPPTNRAVTETYISDLIRKYYDTQDAPYLCVRELGDTTDNAEGNPHYHLFICTANTIKAVRSAVSKIWRGNESYSLKQAKPQMVPEHFNYLCKGTGTGSDDGPDVIYCSGHFTDERIAELNALYWANNDAFKANSKKRKASSISEQVFDLCKHLPPPIDRGQIYDIIHGYYKKRLLHWNPDYVRKLVYQTQMYLEPSDSQCNLDMKNYCVGLPFRPE